MEENQNQTSNKERLEQLEKALKEQQDFIAKQQKTIETLAKEKGNSTSDLAALLARELRANRQVDQSSALSGDKAYDPDDYDEKGKYYFSYRYATVLTDDRRMNQVVKPPYGDPIVFTYLTHKLIGHGKESDAIVMCHYLSYSKKEQKWIEEHTQFKAGIIFTDIRRGHSVKDLHKSSIAAKYFAIAQKWTPTEIAAKAAMYQIQVTTDPEDMRAKIIDKLVDDEFKMGEGMSRKILEAQGREKLFEKTHEKADATA